MDLSNVKSKAPQEALIDEGRRVREMLISKRSDTLLRLFDFLLEQSAKGLHPKEIEIGHAIFRDMPASSAGPAGIRVYVFRLRKKLDEYYEGKSGPRLAVPRGEYCIILTHPRETKTEVSTANGSARAKHSLRGKIFAGMMIGILGTNLAAAWFFWGHLGQSSNSLGDSVFWRPIVVNGKPQTIVLGDYFLFGERANAGLPTKIIRDYSIPSAEDFRARMISASSENQDTIDLNLHFVSSNIAFALRSIWPVFRGISDKSPENVDIIPASQLNPDIIKSSNLVYIGPLDGLGKLLQNPLFEASGFNIGNGYNQLIDTASGKHFASDGDIPAENQIPRRDYGYIASLPGPANTHILVISGSGDQGTLQMAELVSNTIKLNQLRNKLGNKTQAFEALYQVRTMYSQNYGSTLLIVRPIDYMGIWDKAASHDRAK